MRIPTATYRLQFHKEFNFRDAGEVTDYLNALGISDIYASPVFKARPGSSHGYDIVDMNRISDELGGSAEFAALRDRMAAHGLGWIQDLVPNHMAFDFENAMLANVLRMGDASPYFAFFDIDWDHFSPQLSGSVLAPFLGTHYAEALENGEIRLIFDEEGLAVAYYDQRFPLSVETESELLNEILDALADLFPPEDQDLYLEIEAALELAETHPAGVDTAAANLRVMRQIASLCGRNAAIREALDRVLSDFGGDHAVPEAPVRLDRLLSAQNYRLSYWKTATELINYRRFFDINHLITLRMHDAAVFHETHKMIADFCRTGAFTGLRIDHVDGLRDPKGYLDRLREQVPDTWIVVEKILAADEDVPSLWPVQGTTGYEFAARVAGVFCRRQSEEKLSDLYRRFSGEHRRFEEIVRAGKHRVMEKQLAGDLDNLVQTLVRIAASHRYGKDLAPARLKAALATLLAAFGVYRTYVDENGRSAADEARLDAAFETARKLHPDLSYAFDFLERVWTLSLDPELFSGTDEDMDLAPGEWRDWIMQCQQFTAPLAAKGLEDNALYNYNRFVAVNEVGGAPESIGAGAESFYRFLRHRADTRPHSLNATATHDTKRGEDVRARLWVLTEIPDEWAHEVLSWQQANAGLKPEASGLPVPDANMEYLIYQMILGAYPFNPEERETFTGRMQDYVVKAGREAKAHTNWEAPDAAYENGCREFVARLLDPAASGGNGFWERFQPFFERVAHFGIFNSLSQALIKITAPGVPDIYQGTEFFDFSLVDPDNRRPVDYLQRRQALDRIIENPDRAALLKNLLENRTDGRIKMHVMAAALALRRNNPELFASGRVLPLETTGPRAGHLLAFARIRPPDWAITIVPRFLTGLIEAGQDPVGERIWNDTAAILPEGAPAHWQNRLTGEILYAGDRLDAAMVFGRFPGALLTGEIRP